MEWSPNGNWIVYSTLHMDGARAGGNSNIFLMSVKDKYSVKITNYPGDNAHPTWSMDNRMIAFISGFKNIHIMNVACYMGSEECDETSTFITRGLYPSWSPDSRYISFSRDGSIYLTSIESANPKQLITGLNCYHSDWSHDGSKLAANCDGDIYIFNIDGTNSVNLTNGIGNSLNPQWNSDDNKIFFISTWDDEELGITLDLDGSVKSNALFMMNPDGSEVTRISPNNDEYILSYSLMP